MEVVPIPQVPPLLVVPKLKGSDPDSLGRRRGKIRLALLCEAVAIDVDSFLEFGYSLAMARQGLWYQPAPQMRQNITADDHLQTSHFGSGPESEAAERLSSVMVRDFPHFLLSRAVGAHNITVHLLFPHIPVLGDRFKSLTAEQLSRWLDQVFRLYVYKYCEAHYTQHLPASYGHAYANCKAYQVEGRQIETASYQAQQAIGSHRVPSATGKPRIDLAGHA